MGNQFLSLSLFIMLLSFFIVLNAMSTIEETKSSPVLNSLSIAFSKKEQLDQSNVGLTESVDTANRRQEAGNSLDKLEGLFATHITGVDTKQNRFGTEMFAEASVKMFEDEIFGAYAAQGEPQRFVPMLRSLLDAQDTAAYRMDMVLYMSDDFVDESRASVEAYAVRIAKIARALEEAGLPKTLFSIGLAQGHEGHMGLHFRRQYGGGKT